jgi:hypothetical protein
MSLDNMPFGKKKVPAAPEQPHEPEVVQDVFTDFLGVDKNVQADIEDRGLEKRWIDAKQLVENSGFHRRGWEIYRIPESVDMSNTTLLGNSPDRCIRRGTLVLGVRLITIGDAHRREIAILRGRYNKVAKNKMNAVKEAARRQGMGAVPYDEDD